MALIGAHMSVAGGLAKAFERADALGCESMQIFTRNQRQWKHSQLSFSEIEDFYEASQNSGVQKVVSHASYLINLAGSKEMRAKSEAALIEEINRCYQLGINDVVLHPGFACDNDKKTAICNVAESLLNVIDATQNAKVKILLETMAGQGSVLGGDISEFSYILDYVNDDSRIAFCVDMCHVFAAGYELRSSGSYNRFISILEKDVGLNRIKCWHLSDSKKERGSGLDRHAHLEHGEIGLVPFGMLMSDKRFEKVPTILETPKDGAGDAGNLAILRKLRGA